MRSTGKDYKRFAKAFLWLLAAIVAADVTYSCFCYVHFWALTLVPLVLLLIGQAFLEVRGLPSPNGVLPAAASQVRDLKAKFWRWILLCGAVGLLVPAVLMVWYFAFHAQIDGVAPVLWPSSLMFMSLDGPSPSPISTVVFVYAYALVGNIVLYSTIGILTWPLVYLALRFRPSHAGSRSR